MLCSVQVAISAARKVLAGAMKTLNSAGASLPELPIQYADYTEWRRRRRDDDAAVVVGEVGQRLAEVEAVVIENNVTDFVLATAKVVDKALPFDELMAASAG